MPTYKHRNSHANIQSYILACIYVQTDMHTPLYANIKCEVETKPTMVEQTLVELNYFLSSKFQVKKITYNSCNHCVQSKKNP